MSCLSVFVDESGDFGEYQPHSPFYIITLVLHDQKNDLLPYLSKLDAEVKNLGYKQEFAIHTGPLIRREEMYANESPNERRALFSKLFYFVQKAPIHFKSFIFEKRQFENVLKLEARMARELSTFIRENLEYFQGFSHVILYYDNGQHELNRILNTLFATELSDYDVRRVLPKDYKLFQAADLICTLKLLELKCGNGDMTQSERLVFHSKRELRKDFIKPLQKKEFGA